MTERAPLAAQGPRLLRALYRSCTTSSHITSHTVHSTSARSTP